MGSFVSFREVQFGGQENNIRWTNRRGQAALDFAIKHKIPHGGWIPKGRKTEDGILPDKYKLDEMSTASYPKRTEKNILDAVDTLIFSRGKFTGGSALTRRLAKQHDKPCIYLDMNNLPIKEVIEQLIRSSGATSLFDVGRSFS